MTPIRELMEKWERWRFGRNGLGYGLTFLDKCLRGMPGTNCPTCRGRGWTLTYPECPTCCGAGRVKLDPWATRHKVNPAFIRSTHRLPDDPTSEKIDKLVCEFARSPKTLKYYFVIMQEYHRNGTQTIKAERMNISYSYYCKLLERAHDMIEIGLGIKSRKIGGLYT